MRAHLALPWLCFIILQLCCLVLGKVSVAQFKHVQCSPMWSMLSCCRMTAQPCIQARHVPSWTSLLVGHPLFPLQHLPIHTQHRVWHRQLRRLVNEQLASSSGLRCKPECYKHGTCNEEIGLCYCPRHRTGDDCSQVFVALGSDACKCKHTLSVSIASTDC